MLCQDHDQLCCSNCAFVNHRQCTNVTIISETIKNFSTGLKQLEEKIQAIVTDLKKFERNREAGIHSVEESYNARLQEVSDARQRINAALNDIEKNTLTELDEMKTTLQSSMKKDVEKCNKLNDELKQLGDAVQDLGGKNKAELEFIASKKSLSKVQESEEFLNKKTVVIGLSFSFEPNTDIEQYLSKQVGLGKILLADPINVFSCVQTNEYDVSLSSDSHHTTQYITGICVFDNDTIIIADYNLKKLKLVDQHYKVISHLDVPLSVGGMCRISTNKVAVTVCEDTTNGIQLCFINNGQLLKGNQLQLQEECTGIAHHAGTLFVTSRKTLYLYNLSGELLQKIYEDTTSNYRDDEEDDEEDEEDEDEDFIEMPPLRTTPPGQKKRKSNSHADHDKLDLQKRFTQLDLSQCEAKFKQALKDYIDQGVSKDSASLNAGDSELHEFSQLLESTADGLRRELDKFIRNIDTLHELLRVGDRKHSTLDSKLKLTGSGLPSLLEQMSRVRTMVLTIQTEAHDAIQLTAIPSEYEFLDSHVSEKEFVAGVVAGPFLKSKYLPYIPLSKFEVKQIKHGGKVMSKITLNVDLQTGKYSVLQVAGKHIPEHSSFDHDRILHLIKSTKDKCNLDVILDGKMKQTYSFADPHARENFCLQIRQMKNMHSTEAEIDQISLFVGTWNMGNAAMNNCFSTWLKCMGSGASRDRVLGVIPHDVYVVGTQQSSTSEKDWVSRLKAGLKACVLIDMELVEVCSLWGIRLAILCKPEHKAHITRVQRSSVRTGIANALGNKGAVAISFYFNGTSFCFINTHLTSGDEKCNRRNQNFRDIVKNLTLNLGQKHLSLFDITSQFQHVFWLGDLNYPIEEDIKMILRKVHEKDIGFLMERDQLRKQQKHKTSFSGFQEAEVTFLPTYRLERNVPGNKYAWKQVKTTGVRINAPSYCDRVLWKSYPGTFVENVAYGCSDAILSSDHRPVFSSFNVGISSEFIQTLQSLSEMAPVTIVFTTVEAQVKTCCKQYFQLSFYSSCLPDMFRSQPNTSFKENKIGFFTVPVWLKTNLPEMRPLFADQSYLEDQHILIAVIAQDAADESYGECVVSLRGMFSEEHKDFEYLLYHQGEEVGRISGKFHVRTVGKQNNTRTMHRNYSLIAFDTEYQYEDP
ncbi:hypothetical protein DPMN_064984 [Dreissena polymorpha]|uniref:phosphatidylinositol-3,4,5-trisphosphate 5-phosphatase n=2 Tax=Dreissena polymorpha TaxID=45954 RepID=A0A9D4CDR1_DREPO|nr:hypothetical protein DPMN_064984 [Dreissena polymorpha]